MESLMSPIVHRRLRIGADQYTGQKVVDQQFHECDFSGVDLTATEFINCSFYDADSRLGCRFNGATLKEASFRSCDLSLCHFNFIKALGLEISESAVNLKATSKAEIIKAVEASFDYGMAVINEMTPDQMLEQVKVPPFMGGMSSRSRVIYFLLGHTWDTYGQMVVYLRLNGHVPPASQRP